MLRVLFAGDESINILALTQDSLLREAGAWIGSQLQDDAGNPLSAIQFVQVKLERKAFDPDALFHRFLDALTAAAANDPQPGADAAERECPQTLYQKLLTQPQDLPESEREALHRAVRTAIGDRRPDRLAVKADTSKIAAHATAYLGIVNVPVGGGGGDDAREGQAVRAAVLLIRDYEETVYGALTADEARDQADTDCRDLTLFTRTYFQALQKFANDSIRAQQLLALTTDVNQIAQLVLERNQPDRGPRPPHTRRTNPRRRPAPPQPHAPANDRGFRRRRAQRLASGRAARIGRRRLHSARKLPVRPARTPLFRQRLPRHGSRSRGRLRALLCATRIERRDDSGAAWNPDGASAPANSAASYRIIREQRRVWDSLNGRKVRDFEMRHIRPGAISDDDPLIAYARQIAASFDPERPRGSHLLDRLTRRLYEADPLESLAIAGLLRFLLRITDPKHAAAKRIGEVMIDRIRVLERQAGNDVVVTAAERLDSAVFLDWAEFTGDPDERELKRLKHLFGRSRRDASASLPDNFTPLPAFRGLFDVLQPKDGAAGDPREVDQAMKDLQSPDKATRDAAKEKLDKNFGKGAGDKAEQLQYDLKSDDMAKRDAAKKELEGMQKKAEEMAKNPRDYAYGLDDAAAGNGHWVRSKVFFVFYSVEIPETFAEQLQGESRYRGMFCLSVDDATTDPKSEAASNADREDIRTFIHNAVGNLWLLLKQQSLLCQVRQPGVEESITGMLHRLKNDLTTPKLALTKSRDVVLAHADAELALIGEIDAGTGVIDRIHATFDQLKMLSEQQRGDVCLSTLTTGWLGLTFVRNLCICADQELTRWRGSAVGLGDGARTAADRALLELAAVRTEANTRLGRADEKRRSTRQTNDWDSLPDPALSNTDAVNDLLRRVREALTPVLAERGATSPLYVSFQVFDSRALRFQAGGLFTEAFYILVENAFQAFWTYAERSSRGQLRFGLICRAGHAGGESHRDDGIVCELWNSGHVPEEIEQRLNNPSPQPIDKKTHDARSGKTGGSGFGHYFAPSSSRNSAAARKRAGSWTLRSRTPMTISSSRASGCSDLPSSRPRRASTISNPYCPPCERCSATSCASRRMAWRSTRRFSCRTARLRFPSCSAATRSWRRTLQTGGTAWRNTSSATSSRTSPRKSSCSRTFSGGCFGISRTRRRTRPWPHWTASRASDSVCATCANGWRLNPRHCSCAWRIPPRRSGRPPAVGPSRPVRPC